MNSTSRSFLKKKERTLVLMLAPAIFTLILVTVFPLIYLFWTSLYKWEFGAGERLFILFGNYSKIAHDSRFWNSLVLTLWLIAMAVGLQVILGLIISERLHRPFKGKNIVRVLLLLPMVSPPVVVGVMWRMFLQPTSGIVSYLLGLVGIHNPWLANPKTALFAIAVVDTWQWTPFVILMFMAGLATIPDELLDAAMADGAGQLQVFRYIFLPLLKPVILLTVLLRVIEAIKIFPKIFIMTEGGPGTATEIINFYAFRTTFQYSRFGYGSALSFGIFILCILLSIGIIFTLRVRSERG